MSKQRPGRLVKCQDGKLGRTYNDEPPINGKIRVHIFSAHHQKALGAKTQNEAKEGMHIVDDDKPEKRLCDPTTLKVIGMAD